jgi:hypothetical protein
MNDRDLFTEQHFQACMNYVLNAGKLKRTPVHVRIEGVNGGTIDAEIVAYAGEINVLEVPECPRMPVKMAFTHDDGSVEWA